MHSTAPIKFRNLQNFSQFKIISCWKENLVHVPQSKAIYDQCLVRLGNEAVYSKICHSIGKRLKS